LRLGDALGMTLRERNQLLHATGLPAANPQSDLGGHDLASRKQQAAGFKGDRPSQPRPVVMLTTFAEEVSRATD